jgi:hypothetical protein
VVTVPERRLSEVVQLANRLNARVIHWGAFWVDVDGRELAFQLDLPVLTSDALTSDMVRLVLRAIDAVPHFYPAFARVIWTGASASTALTNLLADLPNSDQHEDEGGGDAEDLTEAV